MRPSLGWVAAVVGGAMLAAVAAVGPAPILALVAVLWAAVLIARWPAMTIFFTIVVGTWALPSQIPTSVELAGRTIFLYEPLLAATALYVYAKHRPRRGSMIGAGIFGAALVGATLVGLWHGHETSAILSDFRTPLAVLLAFYVATGIAGTTLATQSLRVIKWGLWWSAALTALAVAGLIQLGGRTEASELVLDGGVTSGGGALRVLTSATHPALAVLCAIVALLILRRATLRQVAPFLVPALLIVFASQSRNSLLALAVAGVFAVLVSRSKPAAVATMLKLAVGAVALAFLFGLTASVFNLPGESAITAQVDSFQQRVVGGLSTEVRSTDSSLEYRARENRYLLEAFKSSPFIGHGLGYAYQPPSGDAGSFFATNGQFYAHNFYYWLLAKAGLLGMLAFLAFVLPPFSRRVPAGIRGPIGATAAALLAVSVVAPMPLSETGSLALGAALGLLAGATPRAAHQERERAGSARPAPRAARSAPALARGRVPQG